MARTPAAGSRVARVLAMLPWIAEHSPVHVDEIAERFDLTPAEVHADIAVLMVCGAGVDPLDAIDVWVDEDGDVHAGHAELLTRPVRLSNADALRVMTAARLMADHAGDDRELFASLADKLAKVVDADGLEIDSEDAPHRDAIRAAIADRRRLRIRYRSVTRDEITERRVDPWHVHAIDGAWYLEAHDHLRGDHRRFRVSRVLEVAVLDETFEMPAGAADAPAAAFVPTPDMERVSLEVGPEARWITEAYPCESVDDLDGGRLRVTMAIGGTAWLERLLLRVGPDAVVVEPAWAAGTGAAVAARILSRY